MNDQEMTIEEAMRIVELNKGKMKGKKYSVYDFIANANAYRRITDRLVDEKTKENWKKERELSQLDCEIRKDLGIWINVNDPKRKRRSS